VLAVLAGASTAAALVVHSNATGPVATVADQRLISTYGLGSDASGAATVMWTAEKFVGAEQESAAVIRVRQQDSKGRWGAPVQLGAVTETDDAQLVVSASGAAAVVWNYVQGGPHSQTVLMVATRPGADAQWSTPRKIWSAPDADGVQMTTSSDASGTTTVAWATYGKANPAIWVANVDAKGASVSQPEQVRAPGMGGADLVLAENAAGVTVLSWQRQLVPPRRIGSLQSFAEMATQRSSADGRWSTPSRLGRFSVRSEPGGGNIWVPVSPSSAVTANGTAAVGWRAGGGGSGVPLQVSTRRPGQARWSSPHTLTPSLGGFGLAAGAHNTIIAVWSRDNGDENSLSTATNAGGARWSSPTGLAHVPGGTLGPVVAAAHGRVAVAPLTGNHSGMRYLTRSPAGRWSTLRRVGTGDNPEVTVGAHGSVTTLWEAFNRHVQYKLQTRTVR
jgi:hypothetical protein